MKFPHLRYLHAKISTSVKKKVKRLQRHSANKVWILQRTENSFFFLTNDTNGKLLTSSNPHKLKRLLLK